MIRGRVLVQLRDEVLDPQGTTVAQALENLGYDDVVSVRQGKVFEVELDTDDPAAAEARLEEMAEKLLANPVIERFRVSVGRAGEADEAAGGAPGGAPGTGGGAEEAGDNGAGTQRPAGAPGPMAPDHGGRRDGLARRTGRDRRGPDRRSGIDRRSFGRDRSDEPPADDRRSDDERRQGKDRRDDSDRRSGEDRREGADRRREERPVPVEERREAWRVPGGGSAGEGNGAGEGEGADEGAR